MSSYRVVYTEAFHEELDAQLAYFVEQGAPASRLSAWLGEFLELVDSLAELPRRFPVAEPESSARGVEVRRMSFGAYLAFYLVDGARREVVILGLRHGARAREGR